MPRLPQPSTILGRHRPREIASAVLADDVGRGLDVFLDRGVAEAVELEEEGRRERQIQLREPVDRVDLRLVHQFDARDRNAELHDQDDGIDCGVVAFTCLLGFRARGIEVLFCSVGAVLELIGARLRGL